MKTQYDQKFFQDLLDSILARKRMDMTIWIGVFKNKVVRRFSGHSYDVRPRDAGCKTTACISGHAAFIDPMVSGTNEYGAIIGNKIVDWTELFGASI